jgi:flagellin-like hook-associated protein FlgL
VQYQGSGIAKETRISSGLSVQNNFAGSEVFQNIDGSSGTFSVFELIDNMITSLENPTNSFQFETSLKNGNSEILTLPETGQEAEISFSVNVDGTTQSISSTIYSNDYSSLVQELNDNFAATGLQAVLSNHNQITLSGSVGSVKIGGYEFKGETDDNHPILFGTGSLSSDFRMLLQEKHGFSSISENITNLFEHFASKRAEVSQSFRRTEETYTNNQDLLISLEEDMSSTRDADMAKILTQIEFLMTKKEAAQATFTRISAKSLFDYLG